MLAPAGEVYQAGTLSGNPLAVAAGLATLELLDERRLPAPRRASPSGSPTVCARRQRPGRAVPGRQRAGPADGLLQRAPRAILRGRAGVRSATPTGRGAASCSRAASTRRRRSSRRGSPRSRTPTSSIERTLEAAAAAFAALAGERRGASAPAGTLLERLRALLRERGRADRDAASTRRRGARMLARGPASPAQLAAAGPRAAGRREEYELLVEAIYEGYLLHYGAAARRARAGGRPAAARRRPPVRDRAGAAGRCSATRRPWPSSPTRSR